MHFDEPWGAVLFWRLDIYGRSSNDAFESSGRIFLLLFTFINVVCSIYVSSVRFEQDS